MKAYNAMFALCVAGLVFSAAADDNSTVAEPAQGNWTADGNATLTPEDDQIYWDDGENSTANGTGSGSASGEDDTEDSGSGDSVEGTDASTTGEPEGTEATPGPDTNSTAPMPGGNESAAGSDSGDGEWIVTDDPEESGSGSTETGEPTNEPTGTDAPATSQAPEGSDSSDGFDVVDGDGTNETNATGGPGAGGNDTDANATATPTTGAPLPTPPPAVLGGCTADLVCRRGGDDAATCTAGACLCSEGFERPVLQSGLLLNRCVPESGPQTVRLYIRLRWADGQFDKLTEAVKGKVRSMVAAVYTTVVGDLIFTRGSVVASGAVDTPLSTLDAGALSPAARFAALAAGDVELAEVLGTELTADVAGESGCPEELFVLEAVRGQPNQPCIPLECVPSAFMFDRKCHPVNAPREAASGGLGGGEVAALVIGVLIGAGLVVGAVLFLVRRNRNQLRAIGDHEMTDLTEDDKDLGKGHATDN